MPADVARVVALGASNLTRGFQTVIATARAAWGPDVEMLAALGHGRSYGAQSRLIVRTLPGILQSGLWRKLETLPVAPTRGLITDVGNDIVYGFSAQQTLEWVEEDGRIVVRRAVRHDSAAVHAALFPEGVPTRKALAELKQGVTVAMRRRHPHD